MSPRANSRDATRHRLLEGVLLRLARGLGVDDFILRGGMLLRHWFRPHDRLAQDLDFVAAFPFSVENVARRFLPVLSDVLVEDGVEYDVERARPEGIFLDTGTPGVRVFASGVAGGLEVDFHIDITAGPQPRPGQVLMEIPTACGEVARVWACRPEAVVGQKVQALCHLGTLGWRPKDLDDLRLLLGRVPMVEADLREAVAAYLADLGRRGAEAASLFGPASWWGMKMSGARWRDFARSPAGRHAPRDLAEVVTEIAGRLGPVLEGL